MDSSMRQTSPLLIKHLGPTIIIIITGALYAMKLITIATSVSENAKFYSPNQSRQIFITDACSSPEIDWLDELQIMNNSVSHVQVPVHISTEIDNLDERQSKNNIKHACTNTPQMCHFQWKVL